MNEEEKIEAAKMSRPKDPDHLHNFVRAFYGKTIPREPICDGHDAPFDYLVGSFFTEEDRAKWSEADRKRYKVHRHCIVHAGRGCSKTVEGGISAHLDSVHLPKCGTKILGGSQRQSDRMHEETKEYSSGEFRPAVVGDATAYKTQFVNGSQIEILVQSETSVRGPHVQKSKLDEVDLFKPSIHKSAFGIHQAMNGIEASLEEFSTAHVPQGLMQRRLKEKKNDPDTHIYTWCVWEVVKKCPHCCTRKNPYKKCYDMVKYDANNMPHRFSDVCGGKAKLADGYFDIQDVWNRFKDWSWETFACEMLCEMPKREISIYKMLSPIYHKMPFWDGWRKGGWQLLLGFDGGYNQPWAVWAIVGKVYPDDEFDTMIFLHNLPNAENQARDLTSSSFADKIVNEHKRLNLPLALAGFTGSAGPDKELVGELNKRRRKLFLPSSGFREGRPCIMVTDTLDARYEAVRSMLGLRPGPEGSPRPGMAFMSGAQWTYESMEGLESETTPDGIPKDRQKKNPACGTEGDHGADAAGYATLGWKRMRKILLESLARKGGSWIAGSG